MAGMECDWTKHFGVLEDIFKTTTKISRSKILKLKFCLKI